MKKLKQNKTYNSIAAFLVVVLPALLIVLLLDGQAMQQGIFLNTKTKVLLALGFESYVFLASFLLLRLSKITVFGFSLMPVLSLLLMLLYLFSQASLWVRLGVWVLSLFLALPFFLLFTKLGKLANKR